MMHRVLKIAAIAAVPILILWGWNKAEDNYTQPQLSVQTFLPAEMIDQAASQPDYFKKRFVRAFDASANGSNEISLNSGFRYRKYSDNYSYAGAKKHDLNNDGRLSILEIENWSRKLNMRRNFFQYPPRLSYFRHLMAFDQNDDGLTTRAELLAGIDAQIFEACPFPRVPEDTKIIYIGAKTGGGVSSVSVAGPDETTTVSNLIIPPDSPPRYIIASSEKPVIWNVMGAKDRIENFVTFGRPSTNRDVKKLKLANVGVRGLDANKVTFLNQSCLLSFSGQKTNKAERAVKRLAERINRQPDILIDEYIVHDVVLALDYKLPPRRDRVNPQTVHETLFTLDPSDVISPTPVTRYDVLPGDLGLQQLVEQGYLSPKQSSREFQVLKNPPRMPAGLAGGRSVEFHYRWLANPPPGYQGHSEFKSFRF